MTGQRTFDLIGPSTQMGAAFLHEKDADTYSAVSPAEMSRRLLHFAGFFRERDVQFGDKIILMPESASVNWVLLDLIAQAMGFVVVMVHATTSAEQLEGIAVETDTKMVVSFKAQLLIVSDQIKTMVTPQVILGSRTKPCTWEEINEVSGKIRPEDLSSIIYTSGTTGEPKGVMLSHQNIMSNVQSIALLIPLRSDQRILSYLPYSHVFERTLIYAYLTHHAHIYFIESSQHLADSLLTVKPHFFTAVPRILEKMHQQGVAQIAAQNLLARKIMRWAVGFSENYQPHLDRHKRPAIQFIRRVLFRGFRKKLGGEIVAILVGAAHLRPQVARVFQAAGITVREGYGMTETSPVMTVNRFEPGLHRLGTVGLPLPGVEVKIETPDEDGAGEIKVRGPNVMMGYFAREEETKQVLDAEGWLSTGDVGATDAQGFLQITDRRKDIFKTSVGKYIAPQELANHFRDSDWIEDIFVIGFQRPYVTALISPNFAMLEQWAAQNEVHWTSPTYMVHNIRVQARMQEEIEELNGRLSNYKKVRNFYLLSQPFSIEEKLLSNTLKPIRKSILQHFAKEIEKMYV